ncbi:ExbD/TolR family protein [Winogradskyella alexanderae]|uniref:Biopolymer transporter ExbD n=1 Tax=Winogradskyella alexanderae TaxID=2877123 RepID=A0ABS7XRX9_9FLAO|nr:biopolymer transporter ExbD [Winogradskyella alexanderae]MCA0132784.1 biopolymer transporter ExbD [Winogradskyella alexanderae]
MKTIRRQPATINTGSMADIAFLLLIFFLVTTTISADKGILRQLPALCPQGENCIVDIPEHNLLRISLNANNELMVNNDIIRIEALKEVVIGFIDNNGGGNCNYCNGIKDKNASDHPKKAIISLSHDKRANYQEYIKVQDEIAKAFFKLRLDYSKKIFDKEPKELSTSEIHTVKSAYPFILSEASLSFK